MINMTVFEGGSSSSVGMTSSLRQSSRAKKPSRRAEEMHLAASAASAVYDKELKATTSGKKGSTTVKKKERARSNPGQKSSRPRSGSEAEKEEADDGGEYEQEGDDDDSEVDIDDGGEDREDEGEDNVGADEAEPSKEGDDDENGASEVFCLCRKGDDGKPMVFCAECNDWFHFKCIGLNKKTAETLSEYICPSCSETTGKVSKTTTIGNSKKTEEEEEDGPPSPAHDDSDTYSPPRRPSTLLKRKSTEQENVRKRSRGESPSGSQKRASVANSPNRPSESSRKASVSEAAPTGSIAVIKTRSETLRKHAVDQLSKTFEAIFDEQEGNEKESSESDRAGKYAVEFERALFEQHSENIPKTTIRTAGKAYRDCLRSFLFNLKDKSNVSLRKKIAISELSAAELAAMSNDELANDEIRKEVERRKRENLEQSILKKEKAPLRKLTHKGEIDIEYEAAQSSRVADEQGEMERAAAAERKIPTEGAGSGTVTSNEGRNTGMMSPPSIPALPSKQAPSMSPIPARRISNSLQSPTTSFDFANVWTAGGASEEKRDEEEEMLDGDDIEGEVPEETDRAEARDGGEDGADTFIDDFLGMPEGTDQAEDEPTSTGKVPASRQEEIRWRGTISMPEEGMCTGTMQQVAGRQLENEEWTSLFPTAHSVIEGRLPSASAAPYLEQSRLTSRTELVVMAFKPSWEPESLKQAPAGGPRDASENTLAYNKLVSYFERRDRYGVLPPHPSARGSLVKDFYILPLPKGGPAPKWLGLCMREDSLNGMELDREETYFIIVAVLFRQTSRQDPHSGYSPPQASAQIYATEQGNAATPPYAGLNTLLGGAGSNTLQDLLKAVGGGNRSPATQLAAAAAAVQPMGHESPPGPGMMQTAAQHPTIESLSEMPKPQLEDMLQKNPNLVDQLLKTLGTTGKSKGTTGTSNAASPRPPGPPPPPPPGLQRATSDPARPPPMPSHQNPPYGQPYNAGYPQQHYLPHAPQGYNSGNTAQFRPMHPQAAPSPPAIEQGWHQNSGYYPRPSSGYAASPPTNYGPPVRGGHRGGHAAPRRY